MKVLIFGATGKTGRLIITSGLEQGHGITAFVRQPSKLKISHENLDIFKGDVADYHKVEAAVKGHDGVISALGAATPFTRDPTIVKGIANIVKAMQKLKVNRFIYQSFLGVREYRPELGFVMDKVVPLVITSVIKDHEAKEQIITTSDLLWTIVRCSMLTNGHSTGKFKEGEHVRSDSIVPAISRADVADFMVSQLADDKYHYRKPRLMY